MGRTRSSPPLDFGSLQGGGATLEPALRRWHSPANGFRRPWLLATVAMAVASTVGACSDPAPVVDSSTRSEVTTTITPSTTTAQAAAAQGSPTPTSSAPPEGEVPDVALPSVASPLSVASVVCPLLDTAQARTALANAVHFPIADSHAQGDGGGGYLTSCRLTRAETLIPDLSATTSDLWVNDYLSVGYLPPDAAGQEFVRGGHWDRLNAYLQSEGQSTGPGTPPASGSPNTVYSYIDPETDALWRAGAFVVGAEGMVEVVFIQEVYPSALGSGTLRDLESERPSLTELEAVALAIAQSYLR